MSDAAEPAPMAAVDLRLRSDPPQVMRLSRQTLSVIGLVATVGIGGVLIYALQPSVPKGQAELYQTDNGAVSESLAGAPKDYAQVPKLGPPLPGDLGRPILSAQQRGVSMTPPPSETTPPAPVPPAPKVREPVRDHARQERDAARLSKVFVGGTSAAVPTGMVSSTPQVAVPANTADTSAMPPASGNVTEPAKRSFLRNSDDGPSESVYRVVRPSSPYVVQAGSIISAALITGIRSDLPGPITAQITQNIYDTVTGRHLLIPQGSRLIGEYDSQVSVGQNRVLLVWNRLIMPDGRSIQLDRLIGADPSGYAGLQDRVNQHWGGMLRAALVSTLLGVGTEVGASDDDDLVRALRQGTTESVGRTGQDLVRRQMAVPPTLTIRPGYELRVIVTRDIVVTEQGEAK